MTAAAFEKWFRQEVAAGRSPDGLRCFVDDENERFWSYSIPGPDGHVYWNGPKVFMRNDKRTRKPCRWVWESLHGSLEPTTDVWAVCGERNCISPEHLTSGRSAARLRYTDEQMIGALQVVAMRLGHTPNTTEWEALRANPTTTVVFQRFTSWAEFCKAAGLATPSAAARKWDENSVLHALNFLKGRLGHFPSSAEFVRCEGWLRQAGLPHNRGTVKRHLKCDNWPDVLRRISGRRTSVSRPNVNRVVRRNED